MYDLGKDYTYPQRGLKLNHLQTNNVFFYHVKNNNNTNVDVVPVVNERVVSRRRKIMSQGNKSKCIETANIPECMTKEKIILIHKEAYN